MIGLRSLAGGVLRALLRPFGMTLAPLKRRSRYIEVEETRTAARAAGLTVPQYVADLWGEVGLVDQVVRELAACGCLAQCEQICEIGPGTGRFLEPILACTAPRCYDIYELDDGWAEYLSGVYSVQRQPTDGHSLKESADGRYGLVHAHHVFVYLDLLTAFEYFDEMARVCALGGFVVFDIYPDDGIGLEIIRDWLQHPERHQVILPRAQTERLMAEHGLRLVHSFEVECRRGPSRYLIFRKEV